MFYLPANGTATYYSSIKKRYYSSNLHKLLAKKVQSSIKDKMNFELQQNNINCEFHKYNLQAPRKKKKHKS